MGRASRTVTVSQACPGQGAEHRRTGHEHYRHKIQQPAALVAEAGAPLPGLQLLLGRAGKGKQLQRLHFPFQGF